MECFCDAYACDNSRTGAHDLQDKLPSKVHVRAADFSSPGHTPVRQLSFPPFLPWHHVLSTARYCPQGFSRRRGTRYSPIWALIDMDYWNHGQGCIKYNPDPGESAKLRSMGVVELPDRGTSARSASMKYRGTDARVRPQLSFHYEVDPGRDLRFPDYNNVRRIG